MARKKYIHLVACFTDHEGYGFPVGAYLSEDKADKKAAKLNKELQDSYSKYEIMSIVIKDYSDD